MLRDPAPVAVLTEGQVDQVLHAVGQVIAPALVAALLLMAFATVVEAMGAWEYRRLVKRMRAKVEADERRAEVLAEGGSAGAGAGVSR